MMNVAFNASVKQYDPVKYWDLESDELFASIKFIKYIIPVGLKGDYVEGKLSNILIKYLHNKNTKKVDGTRKPIYKLKNGTTFGEVWIVNTNCTHTIDADIYKNNMFLSNQCGAFTVDLNGEGEPNTLGIDQYQFRVSRRGVIPVGFIYNVHFFFLYCNKKYFV